MKNNYVFKLVMAAVFSLLALDGMAQLYPFTTHTFTPAGATGPTGPTLGDCTAAYASETWTADPSFFNMTTQGIQEWTVPATGNYSIEVFGAQGGNDTYTSGSEDGGLGARIYGEFALTEGQVIYILVGQQGVDTKVTYADNAAAGGGGGSFVWDPTDLTNPLVAAGGGGGGSGTGYANRDATDGPDGFDAEFYGSGPNGGTGGNGGLPNNGGGSYWAGGGAGWFTDGTGGNNTTANSYTAGSSGAEGGRSPLNGGIGGAVWIDGSGDEGGEGGFGGGGGGGSDNMGTGGGGGYSGGGGANGDSHPDGAGGGGGSYNGGINQSSDPAFNTGDGSVIITLLCEPLTITVSDDTVCVGDEVTIEGTSAGGGTITWDGGISNGVAFTPSAGTTTYTSTSTDSDDCEMTVTIFVGDIPTVDAGADVTFCPGDDVTLTASGTATDWSWDGGVTDGVPFTAPSGTTTYTLTGTIDSTGCEATDMVDVSEVVIDNTVSATGSDLMSNQAGADSYQWLECPAMTPVSGETSQTYASVPDGNYAVEVTLDGCIDTSECQLVHVGLNDLNGLNAEIYPNPTSGQVQVFVGGQFNYTVMNLVGEVIFKGNATDNVVLDLGEEAKGTYFVKILSEGIEITEKLIKL